MIPQRSLFLERLIRRLAPYFISVSADLDEARAEAAETLASYGARTRGELLNAVQVIIFGLSALDTLGETQGSDMSPSMRLRFRGCANNLNRSGQKTEQTLMKRLAREVPVPTPMDREPINDTTDAQAEEILEQTQTKIEACRSRLPGNQPEHSPQPTPQSLQDRNKNLWGSAMMDALAEMGMPVQPAAPA